MHLVVARKIDGADSEAHVMPAIGQGTNALAADPAVTRSRRQEDAALVTGSATFVGDLREEGQLHLAVVRSPIAHARLGSINTAEAAETAGVVSVLTAEDVRADLGAVPMIPTRLSSGLDVAAWLQPVLASEKVRYVGEPIAVVIAETAYAAEDAAELVFGDLEPLAPSPPLPHVRAPLLHSVGDELARLETQLGDPDGAFASAPITIDAEIVIGRHTGMPMETRGLVAVPDGDGVIVYGATKVPHWNASLLAQQLQIPAAQVTLRETSVGGGFGVRGEFYPEDFLVPWAARRLRRPISWIEDRREHLIAANHAREQFHRARLAGDDDGRIIGIMSEFWVDLGAYLRTNGLRAAENTLAMIPGPYDIPHYRGIAHAVLSSRTPTGTYRAPGRVESVHVFEQLLERYAQVIGVDAHEVRHRNLIPREHLPYHRTYEGSSAAYELRDGDYPAVVERVATALGRAAIQARRAAGEAIGAAVVPFIETSKLGPTEYGCVTVDHDGIVHVRSGASSVGQGTRTMLATVVGSVLGVDPSMICVNLLDTVDVPRGVGSYASRSTSMAGSAVHLAAGKLVEKARAVLAREVGVDLDSVRLEDGQFIVTDPPVRRSLAQVATRAMGLDGGPFLAEADFKADVTLRDIGAAGVIARVDPDLGSVALEKVVVAFDTGTIINPQIVEGQLVGAAVQGIGGALLEQLAYDPDGNPTSTSFMDYLVPTLSEVPPIEVFALDSEPSETNPLGVKGVGEAGVTGVVGAIACAVGQAVGDAAVGARTPIDLERVLEAARRRRP